MQVELRVRNTDLTDAFRSYIDRKLRFALSHFGRRVGRVEVKILNDPRAGAIKSCHLSAEMKPFGWVSVTESGLDLHAAIDRAAGRLGRAFAQRLARKQESRFGRQTVRLA